VNKKTDPYAKRESKKYANPIVSREYILDILDNSVGPLTLKQIAKVAGIKTEQDREALRRRLIAMERDGQIHSNRKQAYACVDKLDLIRGKVQGHRDGYGFLIPSDGSEDVYLSSRQMRKVFHGDEVLVRLSPTGVRGRLDGVIVEVVSHNTQQLVGRYYHEQGIGFVRPENVKQSHDVLIPPECTLNAERNQFVMVEIAQQPSRDHLPMGRIIEVLGDHLAPGMEIDVAIRAHEIPHQWPPEVTEEAAQLPAEVAEEDKKHRVDLRSLPFVTIDGEDARDFDDAVYCEAKKSGGWRLFVAIADVSHYVTLNTALDQEAEVRSTSVYFPDFVVPMLPEALSNGLCSLNPEVDRLAMVCEMTISASGRISGYLFYEALIHSHARLTYTQVGQLLAERFEKKPETGLQQQFQSLSPHLDELYHLYKVLRKMREARGAIDFETTETRIVFDEQRKIEKIIPVVRNDAHKLIEECMLCANVCAARFLEKHELVGLYRVHDGPREQKLENLKTFLGELGLSLRARQQPEPAHYQSLLKKIANRADAKIIQTVMLRSLAQAMYQPDNQGHFGLAYPAYTHFTSPIRRYPDLLVHRAIRHVIRSRQASSHVRRVKGSTLIPKQQIYPYTLENMLALGEHTSLAERRADEATRDVVSWLKCEYLQDHVGDVYQGVVTGVTNFGVFVELLDLYVEGLVHITALPSDYYHFEEAHHRLVGERTRRTFCLGDELTVQVTSVILDERKVDFELVGESGKRERNKDSVREKLRRGDFESLDGSVNKSSENKSSKNKKSAKKKIAKKPSTRKKSTTKQSKAKKQASNKRKR
jgi:ribonuclease R